MKKIDDKVSTHQSSHGSSWGIETSSPPSLPHACAPSAWTLECDGNTPFRLPLCGLLIGRSSQCDLVLDDADASRRHAQLMLLDSKPWIVDLGSSNGTLVNGRSVRRERLTEGCELVLGRIHLRLRSAIKGDHLLPDALLAAWSPLENGLALQKTERLRRLAGAETCAWVDGARPVFHWSENGKWEDLGPVRKQLLQELIG